MPIQTERKVTDTKSVTFLYISNVSSAQDQLQANVSSAQDSLQEKANSRSGIDCKQTSVLLRLLVVVQRAASGEVVDLALDVLKNCLVLFGTFIGDTVDNIGVLCDG